MTLRDTLDVAYVLMVEEMTVGTTPGWKAREIVDDVLLSPTARAEREDRRAMGILMAAQGMPPTGRAGR